MIVAGITGGIGSGKTVIANIVKTIGFPVYESDVEAKIIMQQDPVVIEDIQRLFSGSAYIDGHLDRQGIAAEVFGKPQLLQQLNDIVHPAVRRHFRAWSLRQTKPIVFLESAILFESGFYTETDKTILVTAPAVLRAERVMRRDRCTREQAMQRMAQQWPDEKKATLADFIVVNDGVHPLLPQTEQIIHLLNNR